MPLEGSADSVSGNTEEQQFPDPSVSEMKYKIGKKIFLCSDGMTDMLSDGENARYSDKGDSAGIDS